MKKSAVLAAATLALSASAAMADYIIYKDDAYPSVMFVEIEGGPAVEPTVVSAPASISGDPALPVTIGEDGGAETGGEEGSNVDAPASAQGEQQQDQSVAPTTQERVERNVQLGDTPQQAVERARMDEQLDEMVLR